MRYKQVKKGMVLACALLLLGVAACKSEDTTVKTPGDGDVRENVSEENKKDKESEENKIVEVTRAPEVSSAIDEVKQNQATETADRRAVVKLSDAGTEIIGDGCEADGSCLKIKEAGTYEISGTLSDGSIYVNVDNKSEVHLILNGVSIHNETSAAVFCKKAAKVTITLAKGSVNTLSDGTTYVFEEGEDEPDSTLYAKHDLVVNGAGKLIVNSAYKDAVKGKDSLYILGGEIVVNSAEDGIVGRDLLYIADGTLTIDAAADALKASNDVDATLGNAVIDGGVFALTAGTDGIQAENTLTVNGGGFVIKTGGGSANASVKNDTPGFGGGMGWGNWGDWASPTEKEEDTPSTKGLKAGVMLSVAGGRFDLDTADDALHCNADVAISGGEFMISSGDDGVHADETLRIEGNSKIQVTKSYEGLEGLEIAIAGGEITITASDDGLNAAGGADGSGFGRPGAGMFGAGEGEITVSGGSVRIDAGGDGLDSNGNLTINDGTVIVFGPTGGGNGVLDYGGTFALNGGTLLAAGSSDMAQTPTNTSKQYSLAAVLESRAQAGSVVEIIVDGKTVLSEEVPKQFNYIVASTKEFIKDADVSVVVNEKEAYTGTLTDIVTCFGFSGGMGGFGGFGGGNNGAFGGRGDKGGFGNDGMMPDGERPQRPNGERPTFPNGEIPEWPDGGFPAFSWESEET